MQQFCNMPTFTGFTDIIQLGGNSSSSISTPMPPEDVTHLHCQFIVDAPLWASSLRE
jgi:hypothetical protein